LVALVALVALAALVAFTAFVAVSAFLAASTLAPLRSRSAGMEFFAIRLPLIDFTFFLAVWAIGPAAAEPPRATMRARIATTIAGEECRRSMRDTDINNLLDALKQGRRGGRRDSPVEKPYRGRGAARGHAL